MNVKANTAAVQKAASDLGVGKLRHHIFLCRGPNCCAQERGEAVWSFLKGRLKELGLSQKMSPVCRSKVDCLRICQDGPVVLVYPEGTWYHRVDEAKMERILQSHCIQHRPLTEEAFAVDPLSTKASSQLIPGNP